MMVIGCWWQVPAMLPEVVISRFGSVLLIAGLACPKKPLMFWWWNGRHAGFRTR